MTRVVVTEYLDDRRWYWVIGAVGECSSTEVRAEWQFVSLSKMGYYPRG